jgi:hypothetical protein
MEQRLLRLGDIVDDYCPRERRLTNHAVVAIVEDAIRQTRCTTCDAEHVYKHGKEPRRRKKETPDGLYEEVLADVSGTQLVATRASEPDEAAEPQSAAGGDDTAENGDGATPAEEPAWSVHRRLIRATLPKIEGEQPPPRPIPEFTMHQRQAHGRGAHAFRHARGPMREVNGNFRGDGSAGNGNGRDHGGGRPSGAFGRPGRHRSRHPKGPR